MLIEIEEIGKEILNLLNDIQKIKLSNDAKEILNISLLTNSYFPQQNITNEEFFKLKSDWLIKNGDLKMMQDYLIKNQNINENIINVDQVDGFSMLINKDKFRDQKFFDENFFLYLDKKE